MILFDTPPWIMGITLFLFGACIGSFLNVCIYRLPQHEDVWRAWSGLGHPPSTCPYCRTRILWYDNIPVLGWLFIGGRCRFCRHRISFRYPLIELLNGLLWVGLYLAIVPAGYTAQLSESSLATPLGPLSADMPHRDLVFWLHVQYAYFLVLAEALVVASFIDFDLQIIPDSVTLPAMIVGLLGSLTGRVYLTPVWFQDPEVLTAFWELFLAPGQPVPVWMQIAVPAWCRSWPLVHGLMVSLTGLVVGGGIVWFVRIAGQWVFRREAMGFGDVILMAMIGSFLGWQATVVVFFLAPMCALVTVAATWLFSRQREIPFGPYLSLAALLVLFGWQTLFEATERCFGLGPYLPVLGLLMSGLLVAVLWIVQGLKWVLGIPLYDAEWGGEWTSADQLTYIANRDPDAGRGGLAPREWPGAAAGRGVLHQKRWLGR
uniref:Prepilin peptidase n=1 Tax=Schlesneria paludicola TaxID=360056 RepID=A0A7C2PII4_9PLAN